MADLIGGAGADFSPCRRYRYRLWRIWDESLPRAVFCLLNPSKADESENDPTIKRQLRRVAQWAKSGFLEVGGIEVVNIFAYIDTYSENLIELHRKGVDLIGENNNQVILRAAKDAAIFVCGWGSPGLLDGRGDRVIQLVRNAGVTPFALKMNNDGTPTHPLYLAYALLPQEIDQHGLVRVHD